MAQEGWNAGREHRLGPCGARHAGVVLRCGEQGQGEPGHSGLSTCRPAVAKLRLINDKKMKVGADLNGDCRKVQTQELTNSISTFLKTG